MKIDTHRDEVNQDTDMPVHAVPNAEASRNAGTVPTGHEDGPAHVRSQPSWTYIEQASKERRRQKKALKKAPVIKKAGCNCASGVKNSHSLRLVIAAHVRKACVIRQINIIYGNPGTRRNCGRCSSCKPRPVPDPRPLPSEMQTVTNDENTINFPPSSDPLLTIIPETPCERRR
jgi:hypothetical protein